MNPDYKEIAKGVATFAGIVVGVSVVNFVAKKAIDFAFG